MAAKRVSILWAALFALALSGASSAGEKLRVAFIPQLIGIPYFTAMELGGQKAGEDLGIEFLYVGAPTASASEQVRLFENLIQQKADAISISVLDAVSLNPIIRKAREAGIAVFTSDSDSADSERQVYVAQATDRDLGYTLIDRLALQCGGEGRIGIISGESTATNLNAWIGFMKERLAANYPKMELADVRKPGKIPALVGGTASCDKNTALDKKRFKHHSYSAAPFTSSKASFACPSAFLSELVVLVAPVTAATPPGSVWPRYPARYSASPTFVPRPGVSSWSNISMPATPPSRSMPIIYVTTPPKPFAPEVNT